jgi:hypothetical protein
MDWVRADMNVYRARLKTVALRAGVGLGGPVSVVKPSC